MKIIRHKLFDSGGNSEKSWFHPKISEAADGSLLMLLQEVRGSDSYGPVAESVSPDGGRSWSEPVPIAGLEGRDIGDGISEDICDSVPVYHAETHSVMAFGMTVYSRDGRYWNDRVKYWARNRADRLPIYSVWSVRDPEGRWTAVRQRLEFPGSADLCMCCCGCSQMIFVRGELYLPVSCAAWDRKDRSFAVLRASFDGRSLRVGEVGQWLEHPGTGGWLEPSLAFFKGRFFVTLRTTDGFGYVSESVDGLRWSEPVRWRFEDGVELEMKETQQHFLELEGKLYLVYNRRLSYNGHLMRWRAPLLAAPVDTEKLCLEREGERVVLPMMPEDVTEKFNAPLFGNFHPVNFRRDRALITCGEERAFDSYRSGIWMAELYS